jgi:GR25 family glycosyltransferase involved in LPS biosynthesis
MIILNISIIHSKHLIQRKEILDKFLLKLGDINDVIINTKYIESYSISELKSQYDQINKDINYDKLNDDQNINNEDINMFNNLIQPISINEISRYMKHIVALKQIVDDNSSNDFKKYYLVIEDDIVFHNETINLLENFLKENEPNEYDFVFTGLPKIENINKNFKHNVDNNNVLNMYKIIPAADSYFINKETASKILEKLTPIKWRFNIQLSYILHSNKKCINPLLTKNIFIEGSKSGAYLSSIYPNNNFLYNKEYSEAINMLNISNYDSLSESDINKLENTISQMNQDHPETQHILGVLSFTKKNYKEARDYFMNALEGYTINNGVINRNSQLLCNLIKIHKFIDDDKIEKNDNPILEKINEEMNITINKEIDL